LLEVVEIAAKALGCGPIFGSPKQHIELFALLAALRLQFLPLLLGRRSAHSLFLKALRSQADAVRGKKKARYDVRELVFDRVARLVLPLLAARLVGVILDLENKDSRAD
jgi:hypothetical protein